MSEYEAATLAVWRHAETMQEIEARIAAMRGPQ